MYGPNAVSAEDAVIASLAPTAEASSSADAGPTEAFASRMLANERRVEVAHRRTGYSRLVSADEFRAAFSAFRTTMNADVSAVTDAADLNCTDVFVEHPANVIERAIIDEISEYRYAPYLLCGSFFCWFRHKRTTHSHLLIPHAYCPSSGTLSRPSAALPPRSLRTPAPRLSPLPSSRALARASQLLLTWKRLWLT